MKIILQTKRLYAAVPSMESLENRAKLLCNREVSRFLGNGMPKSRGEVKEFLQKNIDHYDEHGFCLFDIYEKDSNQFIGDAGLIHEALNPQNPNVEVGYRLLKEFWGKGYATELTQAFIDVGFEEFKLDKIFAFCKAENVASANVMRKSGMKQNGKYLYGGKSECDSSVILAKKNYRA